MPAADRQKAYRQRLAQSMERAARIEQAAKDVCYMLRDSDKPTAVKIRAMLSEALGE